MKYRQVTTEDRHLIWTLKCHGRTIAEIAVLASKHRSTIYRELKRNKHKGIRYRLDRACEMARARRYKSRRNSHFSQREWNLVVHYLTKEDWSPEQISLRLGMKKLLSISHGTIYNRIWRDKWEGGNLYSHLRQFPKRRRKAYRGRDSRGILRGKRHISTRPQGAHNRSRVGHFEGDLVHGNTGKPCILTLVDRKTRLTIISKLKNKTMSEVNRKISPIIENYGIKTITMDNGCEFHGYKRVEKRTGVKYYFATPHHSWERGTVENTNGLIRQYFPKKKSMKLVNQWKCNRVMKKLNTRPRKCLGAKTPEECYE